MGWEQNDGAFEENQQGGNGKENTQRAKAPGWEGETVDQRNQHGTGIVGISADQGGRVNTTKIVLAAYLLLLAPVAYGWENKVTHPQLTEKAATMTPFVDNSQSYSYDRKNLTPTLWLRAGAELEDAGSNFNLSKARFKNHFHNPLAGMEPALGAGSPGGLTDMMSGESMLLWAQDAANQAGFEGGDWSWPTVREHYRRSLTTTNPAGRDMFMAMTYLGLGYQMHLVQDTGQPDHVRNDAHPIDGSGYLWGFETWARKKPQLVDDYMTTSNKPLVNLTQPLLEGYSPVGRLMDTREYYKRGTPEGSMAQGLAEYTNANFFSDGTIFAARYAHDGSHYFPYPRREGTDVQSYFDGTKAPETVVGEDKKTVKGLWIAKTATEGQSIPHLVRIGAFAEFANFLLGEGENFYDCLFRDEVTYMDYAKELVPRAVGYSAAVIDYFFRGKVFIEPTENGVTFRSITADAQNLTPGEVMGAGEAWLIVRYKPLAETAVAGTKFQLENPSDGTALGDYAYKISKPLNVDMSAPQHLTFDFSEDVLPYVFGDMSMQMVFKGKLGNEEGAVASSIFVPIEGVYSDIDISLPSSGIYAKVEDASAGASFKELRVTAHTDIPGGLTGGQFKLALEYREGASNPFLSAPVNTAPENAASYLLLVEETSGVNSLQQGQATELVFDLAAAPLPGWATDVYVNVLYVDPATSKNLAIGFRDISEPTPVDVFNNADKICIGNSWYDAGSPGVVSMADGDKDGFPELFDPYPHDIGEILQKASSAGASVTASAEDFTLQSFPILPGGNLRRLGYLLTDYDFSYSFMETWTAADPVNDPYVLLDYPSSHAGTAVRNQEGVYPVMYNIRGNPMWWGAGVIWDNEQYQSTGCTWSGL